MAIVTGAGDGIGAATARLFAAHGARLVLSDRSGQAERVAAELELSRASYLRVDLENPEHAARLVDHAIDAFGQIDIVVANAGVMPVGSIATQTLDDFRLALSVNLESTFVLVQAAAARLRPGSSIVIDASVHALLGHPDRIGYDASKGGLVALTRSAAVDLAGRGTRVNAVCPGTIDTPMLRDYLATVPDEQSAMAELRRAHPLGRIGTADEVAEAILFLASSRASFITGAILPVDGGYSMAKT